MSELCAHTQILSQTIACSMLYKYVVYISKRFRLFGFYHVDDTGEGGGQNRREPKLI